MLINIFKNSLLNSLGSVAINPFLKPRIVSVVENFSLGCEQKFRIKKRNSFPYQILLYHRVLPEYDPFGLGVVPVDLFRIHMELMSTYFRIISLPELLLKIEKNALQPNCLCLTFDDGYYDNYKYAFPILKELKIPATIFLTTDFIGTNEVPWHNRVLNIIKDTEMEKIQFEYNGMKWVELSDVNKKIAFAHSLLEWLKMLLPEERDDKIYQLREICQINEDQNNRKMLNWKEVEEMHQAGISFGAHTKTHPILSLLSKDQIEEEIIGSRLAIEKRLSIPIDVFAYPNGKREDYDEFCIQVVKKAGFKGAVTSYGAVNYSKKDLFELSRFLPWERNPKGFFGRIILERFKN